MCRTDELATLGAEVDLADRALGIAIQRRTEFQIAHPEFSGRLPVIRPASLTPLDAEFRAIQEGVNKAQEAFTTACIRYADAKPD